MKIALVHDYIKEYGGAERVLESLHELFPKAPIFTTVYLPSYLGPHRSRVEKWNIKPSFLQHLPLKAKLISPIRLVAPLVFSRMDFSDYDVVLVSATGAYTPNKIKKAHAVHICYYHTPPRYLYGLPTARVWKKNSLVRILAEVANHFLRMEDFESAQNVDIPIANSKEVKARIQKFYRKNAVIVYPPVDLKMAKKFAKNQKEDFFVAGGRLARAKRIDLAIKAANKLGFKLKVFGKDFAGYEEELKNLAGQNVEFLGEISDQEKWEILAGAKALIFPAQHEDFGILPVEAMAVGTPVIAHFSGGVKETVVDGKTGVFFDKATASSLIITIKKFEKTKIKAVDCTRQASKFSEEQFKEKIKQIVHSSVK